MANPVQILLVSGILLGLGWAAYEASHDLPSLPAAEVEQVGTTELDLSLPEVPKLPLANYAATLERPLFSASRSPEASSAPQTVAPIQNTVTPDMRVTAIFIREGARTAMLESGTSPEQRLVTEGESVYGWEVRDIDDQSVTVVSGGREHRIELRQFPPPEIRQPPKPRNAPARRSSRFPLPSRPPVSRTRQPNDID